MKDIVRFYRSKELERILGVHYNTIKNWMNAGEFPEPIHSRRRGRLRLWSKPLVDSWIAEKIKQEQHFFSHKKLGVSG